MEETATLLIRVQADQAGAAKDKLRQLGFAAKEAETATGGLMAAWKGLGGLLAGGAVLGAAISGLTKLRDVAKQFESLEAQLKTATGSAKNAREAFVAIQDFARETPYDLAQSTEAFIKLVNLGLEPSERALRSYGDTASAMGRSLSDMVNAVARAATGEFEPLKTFGIKARQEADGLTFTFRGVTEKVGNSAKEIEQYFIKLGERNFAGAMSERMATLEGKLSNLGDAWDFLFATIAKSGAGDLMKESIDVAINAITELTDMIASGQLSAYIDALAYKFESLSDGIYNAFANITSVLDMAFQYWTTDGKGAVDFLVRAFKEMPENIRASVMIISGAFAGVYEMAAASAKGIVQAFSATFSYLVDTAVNVGKEIWSHLKPGADAFDYTKAQAAAFEQYSSKIGEAWDNTKKGIDAASDAYDEFLGQTLDDREESIKTFEAKVAGANRLRAAYDAVKIARQGAEGKTDRLAQYRSSGDETSAEFRRLVDMLRTEAQVLQDTYNKRRALIIGNTKKDSDLQVELLRQNKERYEAEKKELVNSIAYDVPVTGWNEMDDLNMQQAALDDANTKRLRALREARNAELITEEEYARRKAQVEQRHARESIEIERAKNQAKLSLASGFFGNIATIASVFGARGARIAKAAAIIQTTIKTYESATSAYASLAGIPYVGPALGAVAAAAAIAAGMANVAMIKSQGYSGMYAGGGMIPAGKWGIAREAGPEIIHGPAVVTSARATADLGGKSGMPHVIVNIEKGEGVEVQQTGQREENGAMILEFIAKQVQKRVAGDIREGTGPIAQELARQGLRRGVT